MTYAMIPPANEFDVKFIRHGVKLLAPKQKTHLKNFCWAPFNNIKWLEPILTECLPLGFFRFA